MQTRTWLEGLKALVLAFPDRDQTAVVQEERGRLYQQHLADLTDEQWAHAVREAIRHERWFPTIAALRDYADGFRPATLPALPEPPRTPEQMEADREACRRGLDLVRAAVAETPAPPAPKPYIESATVVVVTPERVAELKAGLQRAGKEQVLEGGTR